MANIKFMGGNKEGKKNILFFHGLNGHYDKTWSGGQAKKKEFWPTWLCSKDPELCIWSVEYESNTVTFNDPGMAFKDRAGNIAESIYIKAEFQQGEIILIGHSLGGLLIKQLIRLSSDQSDRVEARNFLSRVTGVAFLGTPHTGSDLSTFGNSFLLTALLKCVHFKVTTITASLYRNNADLRDLNVWYRDWERKNMVRHLILGESKSSFILGMIVKPDSSDPGLSARMIPVDTDHENICKPKGIEDQIYLLIENFVLSSNPDPQKTWINSHFGNINSGWHSYRSWAGENHKNGEEFIIDEKIKFTESQSVNKGKKSALDILNSVRNKLSVGGNSVRLVGLSGVGKTRFALALFENGHGTNPLNQNKVYYTDTSFSPNPIPTALAEKLISSKESAVLIVDNCASELHNTLTKLIQSNSRTISLLTIEYDIRDDLPEGTDVITMEANSEELIKSLITRDFPYISQNSVAKISEFSGGNARVAIALASTIGKKDDISSLQDEDLFNRIFNQRHTFDNQLKRAAEILSLMYSFELNSNENFSDEFLYLSTISGISPDQLYIFAREIKRRGLAQSRDKWMAILPHPIANKLAHIGLENTPKKKILTYINPTKSLRSFKSLTRRLGYLSNSRESYEMAREILAAGGVLDQIILEAPNDNETDYNLIFSIIKNIAPIANHETLNFIRRIKEGDSKEFFFSRENPAYITITRLLRSLAYKKEYFEDCAWLLYEFAVNEKPDEKNNSIADLLGSLFTLYLSGTHATLDQRIDFIRKSYNKDHRHLTNLMLMKLLETSHFTSFYGFDFGSEVRDYGYKPSRSDEVVEWYQKSILFIDEIVDNYRDMSTSINELISANFRGLWDISKLRDVIYNITMKLHKLQGGEKLWNAVSSTIKFDFESMDEAGREQINQIELDLRPSSLIEKLELFVFSNQHGFYGLEELDSEGNILKYGNDVATETAYALGKEVANQEKPFISSLISRAIIASCDFQRMSKFAESLIENISDKQFIIDTIISECNLNFERIRLHFICGSIKGLSNSNIELAHEFLDITLNNEHFDYIFPSLQIAMTLDERSLRRIHLHLAKEKLDVLHYNGLSIGRRHDSIKDEDLVIILGLLLKHMNGIRVAFEILQMKFFSGRHGGSVLSDTLLSFAKNLSVASLIETDISSDEIAFHNLKEVLVQSFKDATVDEYEVLLKAMLSQAIRRGYRSKNLQEILTLIADNHFELILNSLSILKGEINTKFFEFIERISGDKGIHIDDKNINSIIPWCQEDPELRFSCIAKIVEPYTKVDGNYRWSELSLSLLEHCPNVDEILGALTSTFIPYSWSGSRTTKIEEKLGLLIELQGSSNKIISESANKNLGLIKEKVERIKEIELKEFRENEERFE